MRAASTYRAARRLIHLGALINDNGGVSAFCYAKPRAINLAKATWTNRSEAVTCPRCARRLRQRARA